MNNDYELKIVKKDGVNLVEFSNHTQNFVEVVITVDGKDLKTGEAYQPKMRGYCYPPNYSREIKRPAVEVSASSKIEAYIYSGTGHYKTPDYDVPPFIRYKLYQKDYSGENIISLIQRKTTRKAVFNRFTSHPAKVLSLQN